MSNKVTYRQQYTRCGKERCRKCKEGAGHGPYWYAYWSENRRTISKYIGIQLPADIEIERQTALEVDEGRATSATNGAAGLARGMPLQSNTQELRIFVLGQFCVELLQGNEWQPVINRTWRRHRARALLGCLLSSPGRRLGREQAIEALWPDLEMETAANRLNGAVHELRQILEPGIARPAASRMLRLERDVLELAEARGAYASAMEPLNRLLATDPTDEIAIQRLMKLLTQLDRRGEALNTYRRLAARLEQIYDSEPLPETRDLYEKLRQGHFDKVLLPEILITNDEHLPGKQEPGEHTQNTSTKEDMPGDTEQTQPEQKSTS